MARSSRSVPRKPDFDIDLSTKEGLLRYARFYLDRAANIAGMCMTDHLDDKDLVRDMHDVIGALGALSDTLQLLGLRTRNASDQDETG